MDKAKLTPEGELMYRIIEQWGNVIAMPKIEGWIKEYGDNRAKAAVLPADDAVQNWFEENIDKECSASSAVYKFRLWLESLQVARQAGSVWSLSVIDKATGDRHDVNKLVYHPENDPEPHVWCDTWYGHHVIGQDCEWANPVTPVAEPTVDNVRYELRLALRDMIKLVKRIYGDNAIPVEHQKRLDAADVMLKKHSKITDVLRTPAAAREEVDPQELWDEHSALIGDDIDDLSFWAGREVMKKEDFFKALKQQKNP